MVTRRRLTAARQWGRGVVNRACQPGFGMALAVLLFVLQPLLPTTGEAAHVVHLLLWVIAGVLMIGMVVWTAGLWKVPSADASVEPQVELPGFDTLAGAPIDTLAGTAVDAPAIEIELPAAAAPYAPPAVEPAFRFDMAAPTGFPRPGSGSGVGISTRLFGRRILD